MANEKYPKELSIKNWADLAKDFEGADILLGNGFSLCLKGHFDYKSLFKEFINKCNLEDRKIFCSFSTSNFELIQEILLNALKVNKLFNIETRDIERSIERLKTGLIKSIQDNHPRSYQIDWGQLQNISKQLDNFGDIFTLNYDLFLYHIILSIKDLNKEQGKGAPYSDYFWGDHEFDRGFKEFMDYDNYHPKHVRYLHGALFLFKISPATLKLKRGNDAKELVMMIGDAIETGVMPLFVSEGKSKEKLKAIERSNYLSFCYDALKESSKSIVIFGASLSKQDAHIVDAINYNKNKRKLAIAIHLGKKSKNELEEEIKRFRDNFPRYHKIEFFDSETIFKF